MKRRYFHYREFWDVPRNLLVATDADTWLLESLFDEVKDEYPDAYQVYRLEVKLGEQMDQLWRIVRDGQSKTWIGTVVIRDIRFNATKGCFFQSEAFERLIRQEENEPLVR